MVSSSIWSLTTSDLHDSFEAINSLKILTLIDALTRGRLVQDKASREPRLNCRNWECGVVIPIPAKSREALDSNLSSHIDAGLTSFSDHVPVPMRYPGEKMEKKKPWTMFNSALTG